MHPCTQELSSQLHRLDQPRPGLSASTASQQAQSAAAGKGHESGGVGSTGGSSAVVSADLAARQQRLEASMARFLPMPHGPMHGGAAGGSQPRNGKGWGAHSQEPLLCLAPVSNCAFLSRDPSAWGLGGPGLPLPSSAAPDAEEQFGFGEQQLPPLEEGLPWGVGGMEAGAGAAWGEAAAGGAQWEGMGAGDMMWGSWGRGLGGSAGWVGGDVLGLGLPEEQLPGAVFGQLELLEGELAGIKRGLQVCVGSVSLLKPHFMSIISTSKVGMSRLRTGVGGCVRVTVLCHGL